MIKVVKSVSKKNIFAKKIIEFHFVDYDYHDGNLLSLEILKEKFDVVVGEEFDGIWYVRNTVVYKDIKIIFMWHEDIGNYIYSERQDSEAIGVVEELLEVLVKELNRTFKAARVVKEDFGD